MRPRIIPGTRLLPALNKNEMTRVFLKLLMILLLVFFAGLLIPQGLQMPVEGATSGDYNPETFWAYPWGKSVTHKGVDIFARKGTAIHSATYGIVAFTGPNGRGGNSVLILGPKWRFHYYAHLDKIEVKRFALVSRKRKIGTVGNTGNAAYTPSHLHYVIATPVPYLWRADESPQGWKKMFYLNPAEYLKNS